jgi:hypothetical protein
MHLQEAMLRNTVNGFRQRAARYRRLASLLDRNGASGRLNAFAEEIDKCVGQMERAIAQVRMHPGRTQLLIAEIDAHVAGFREAKAALATAPSGVRYNGPDLREVARLCAEEARAASEPSQGRALLAKVAELEDAANAIDEATSSAEEEAVREHELAAMEDGTDGPPNWKMRFATVARRPSVVR